MCRDRDKETVTMIYIGLETDTESMIYIRLGPRVAETMLNSSSLAKWSLGT